jgi:eukaryotic-like serine/threonine-protein kinase
VSDPNPPSLREGAIFQGRYRVVRFIGAGGMGEVYEVVHLETRRRRALKRMLPSRVEDPDLRARFELEKTIRADIRSQHVVDTIDAGDDDDGLPFLVMELLEGEDLAAILRQQKRLPAALVITLLHHAALALDRTHAAGIIHRDLKPENLFVTLRDDGSPHLKVLDFGIAKLIARSAEAAPTTSAVGTAVYMAPEQMRGAGDIGAAADVYALGHVAYALLTGQAYWETERRALPNMIALHLKVAAGAKESAIARAARSGVDLPPAFDAWFAKATAPAPRERFPSASKLVEELARSLGVPCPKEGAAELDVTVRVGPSSRPPAQAKAGFAPIYRRIFVATLVVLAVIVGVVASWRYLFISATPQEVSAEPSGSRVAPTGAPATVSASIAGSKVSVDPASDGSRRTASPGDAPSAAGARGVQASPSQRSWRPKDAGAVAPASPTASSQSSDVTGIYAP